MTSKRNLGPILAIAGGAIAIAAVITGFIVIGGPGDARERRLDEITMNRLTDTLSTIQCAFNADGATPATVEQARKARYVADDGKGPFTACDATPDDASATDGDQPPVLGGVTYKPVNATNIRLCGNFRRPKTDDQRDYYRGSLWTAYPQLQDARPAGIHCFQLELIKNADLSNFTVSHAGHMDAFE